MKKTQKPLVLMLLVVTIILSSLAYAAAVELRVGVTNLPPSFEVQKEVSITGNRIFYNVFDSLIGMNLEENSVLEPNLALSWERTTDTTLEVKLRPNVVWHNGDPFTSEDVKFSIDRALTGDRFSLVKGQWGVITKVETPDPLTLIIHTDTPDPVLEYRLATLWGSWIVPKNYIEEHGDEYFSRNPIGTGPFKVVDYRSNLVVLERFDDYWGEAANVDSVRYLEIPEASARITALVNNEVDIVDSIPPDLVSMVKEYDNVQIEPNSIQNVHLLVFNTPNPLVSDKKFRQALSLGIDRDLIVGVLWEDGGASNVRGHQLPVYGPMYLEDRPLTPYDPDKARQLVKESGYSGETVYYDVMPGYYPCNVEAAEIILEMWKEIGVNAEIRFTTSFWQNSDFSVHPWGYSPRFPDPMGGLWLLWGPTGSRQVAGHWSNVPPRFNELGKMLEREMDLEKRREIFAEMLDIFEDDSPAMTLWQPVEYWGISKNIEWVPSDTQIVDFGAGRLNVK